MAAGRVADRRPALRKDALAPLEALLERVADALGPDTSEAELWRAWARLVLRASARRLLAARGLALPRDAKLFELGSADALLEARARDGELGQALDAVCRHFLGDAASAEPELVGAVFEQLFGLGVQRSRGRLRLVPARRRKRSGSFYTPSSLSDEVMRRALAELAECGRLDAADLSVCDPACGAGAFLIAAGRHILAARAAREGARGGEFDADHERRLLVTRVLAGVDLEPLALDVASLVLWMFAGDPELATAELRLSAGDALTGRGFDGGPSGANDERALDWCVAFAGARERGFDLVIGNPPWVAFAGRAAQPLTARRRAFYAARYRAFHGYPTLHAMFVERALELAPRGVVALVVPSPIADLDGYRSLRRVLQERHAPCEPMTEFGQDAFPEVTQPCFALIARPRRPGEPPAAPPDRRFELSERSRAGLEARPLSVPAALEKLRQAPALPRELFGEMGFQTTRQVTEKLLLRGDLPDEAHSYPLLEGREVVEFRVGKPRLFLRPDAELLRRAGCRLRPAGDYERVRFVVRQTAKAPIAALHSGLPFRNTLLAGFETAELPADLMVGLLNSSLYRALHLASQRDARQAVFPQVKIAHLRALPSPPRDAPELFERIRALVGEASGRGASGELRAALDRAVFELFRLSARESGEVLAFLSERAPELCSTS